MSAVFGIDTPTSKYNDGRGILFSIQIWMLDWGLRLKTEYQRPFLNNQKFCTEIVHFLEI